MWEQAESAPILYFSRHIVSHILRAREFFGVRGGVQRTNLGRQLPRAPRSYVPVGKLAFCWRNFLEKASACMKEIFCLRFRNLAALCRAKLWSKCTLEYNFFMQTAVLCE